MQALIDSKANINMQTSKSGETALHMAAEKGKMDLVKLLLDSGAKADIRDKSTPPLLPYDLAKKNGHSAVASLLIVPGAETGGCCIIS
jgi:ankyrin repeat protein